MSSYAAAPGAGMAIAPPRTAHGFVDPTRRGSVWQQIAVGVLGVVLALVIVVGQVSVATTAGIARNLNANVKQIRDGNETMKVIVEKAAPSVEMERVLAQQQQVLANTGATLKILNGQLAGINTTTNELKKTVATMQQTSGQLAGGVAGMNRDTQAMVALLAPLPGQTQKTQDSLDQIAGDSAAINDELGAISGKMARYGLPRAQGVKGRR